MPDIDRYDVVVIGAGPGGTAAALRAADLGARVVVLEAARLGGTCVNSGCVPTRVLARAARLVRDARSAREHGVVVGDVTLDWRGVVERVHARVDEVRAMKREAERFAAAGVDLVQEGRARFVDPHTLELDSGRHVAGDAVLVCVGGHARRLPIPGAELAILPDEVLDLPALPQRVAVIGGGNTGAQLATVLDAFGSRVTLLDLAPRILMASDAAIADEVTAAFVARGVDVRVGIDGVSRLAHSADGAIDLVLVEDGAERTIEVDAVIMATGWPADVDDLGLEHAGLRVERGAIPADEYLRTAVPHVFAVGDANGRDMLVQAAQFEGEAAAENAVLGASVRAPHRLLPAGGFTDPDYAGVGFTEEQARARDPRCVVATIRYDALDRAVIDDRDVGFLKLVVDRSRSTVLGAHAAGESAVEVVQALTTAMAAGVRVQTLAEVRFAYPTYSAIIGMAARAVLAAS
ncbi:dihydrolipoyl dehydrogenase family protein [Agrococcus sp. SGAir0287]|uniref:dihydrolipoyl dehydrogenase family protein n=1 Tax=Agrococcus sp. SGAir0287 TaxID=2070347 RepID=UPI0010CD09A8|nr:NAD(P)/FAD-dependent oxidoreductase [Agrococcus sp. SGAir0287]QCR19432.1 NAD(P)/FAD-dependent oxidoreductase [Agrococcus sp. SGAir0287]